MKQNKIAKLALEDGTIYTGTSFGASGTTDGEAVFNTSLMGYQEIMTDPSYRGQIVTMTYPLIGNYGTSQEDVESPQIQVSGFVIKELSLQHSNFRADQSIQDYLQSNNIIGLCDIDTRALTRKLRVDGAMKSVISTEILDDAELVKLARQSQGLVGRDLVCEVTGNKPVKWDKGFHSKFSGPITNQADNAKRYHIVAIDCGMKQNIARNLVEAGFDVTIVPAQTTADEILKLNPDGIFVSNGPGDPEPITYTVETIKQLIEKEIPTFGICLGLQLISLALGAKTYKLKFGHRGGNQPVKNLDTDRVEITSQNHGFAVDMDSINQDDVRVSHINLNDNTVEGIAHKKLPLFAVQYHPEASPGPHDANYLFHSFYKMVDSGKQLEAIC